VKRRVIKVPVSNAQVLEIGEDCGNLGQNNFVIEKIGEPFTDDKGQEMVDITLVERAKQ